MSTWRDDVMDVVVECASVHPVRGDRQEMRIDKRVEHRLAYRAIDAAEAFGLRDSQPQTRHLEELAAQPFDRALHHRESSTVKPGAERINTDWH